MDYSKLTLAEVCAALEGIAQEADTVFGRLNPRQLNWRPDQTRWGVAQCFEHLLTANRMMLSAARGRLDGSQPQTIWQRIPALPGLLGGALIRSQAPTAARKFTAPPGARPVFTRIPDDVVQRFAEQQREIARWIGTLGEREARLIMTSPFIRVVTYSVLDGCRLMVAHDWRHIEQARRVTALAEFPTGAE